MPEQPQLIGPCFHRPLLVGREAGGDEVAGLPVPVDGGDDAVVGAGQRAGAVDDLAEHGVEVEAAADAQDGRRQGGVAFGRVADSPYRFVLFSQGSVLRAPRAPGLPPTDFSPDGFQRVILVT